MNSFHQHIVACIVVAIASMAGPANAADTDAAKAQYEQERARCLSGSTGQTQESCLKSAGAAYDATRNGRLQNPNESYRANAMTRCAALSGGDRTDCEARVNAGTSQDAVRRGGDIKQTVTTIPAPPETK